MELINPQFNNLIAVIAILVGLIISVWLVVGLYGVRNRSSENDLPVEAFNPGEHESGAHVPIVLVLFYIFIALSLILYVLYIKFGGISY